MRPLRVVVANANLNVGGAERILAQLAKGLAAAGVEVHVCCLYDAGPIGERLRREGISVTDRFLRTKRDVAGVVRLARWLRRVRPDVFYFNNQPLTQLWGALAARAAGVPVQVTAFHFSFRDQAKKRRGPALNRVLGRGVDLCIALSERQRDYLVARESMPPERIVVIPNGVESSRFDVSPEAAARKRAELGLPQEAVVVGLVAQLRPEKNHEMFLRAASRVLPLRDDVYFVAAGGGDAHARLEAAAAAMGMAERVRFLGPREDVPELMAACDVGVLCSFGETFPLAVLEFMAAGRPVVTTDVGAVAEIAVPGETALVVPVDDDAALAERLLDLAADPERRRDMGAAGRRRALSYFTDDAMVRRTKEALERAVGGASGGSHDAPVIVVGPRHSARGGVSTHLRTHVEGGLREWFDLVPIEVGYWDTPASTAARVFDALRKMLQLRRLLRRHDQAIVHLNPSMDTKSIVRDMPFLWIAARRRAPVVVQFHGQLMHRFKAARNPLFRRVVLASLRRARLIVVLSAVQARSLEQVLGASSGLRVREMPALFLDLAPYDALQTRRSTGERIRRFVFLGRIAREKGVGELLDAVARIAPEYPDVELDVVGSGPDEDALRDRARSLGVADNVAWHGYMEGDAKLALLARADAFVLPSWGEGLPNALVESMATGLPVVVTETGAMPQVVEHGVNGLVVPVKDAAALADALLRLIRRPEEALEMGRRNRALAAERFGLDRQVEAWRGIYEGVRRSG